MNRGGKYAQAQQHFEQAKHQAGMAHEDLMAQSIDGYIPMARVLARPDDPAARKAYDDATRHLNEEGSDEAKQYVQQLSAALEVVRAGAQRQ